MVKAPPADEARGVSICGTRQRETASRQVWAKAGTCGAPTKLYAKARIGLTTLRPVQTKRSRNQRVWKLRSPHWDDDATVSRLQAALW
jgi:hypothetical protein